MQPFSLGVNQHLLVCFHRKAKAIGVAFDDADQDWAFRLLLHSSTDDIMLYITTFKERDLTRQCFLKRIYFTIYEIVDFKIWLVEML